MDELDRLFRRLVHNIRLGFPDLLTRPFEVQQVYQTIVPYRHHRKELEIDSNDEYEIAVMRLLSGEKGYVLGEPQLQDALRQELMSPNPDTSLFRMWATSQVSLAPDALRAVEASPSGSMPGLRATAATPGLRSTGASPIAARPGVSGSGGGGPAAGGGPRAAGTPPARPSVAAGIRPEAAARTPGPTASGSGAGAPAPAPAASRPAPLPNAYPSGAPASAGAAPAAAPPRVTGGGACRYCGGALPDGRAITYCPHCGQNLTVVHCPACGSELELGWKFCVSCGRSVA